MRSARRSWNESLGGRRNVKRLLLLLTTLALSATTLLATVKGAPETRQTPGGEAVATQPAHEPSAGAPAEQPAHPEGAAEGHARAVEHEAGEAEAAESPWATVARLFNFALLAGILIYLLRSPFGAFLENRRVQIRKQLTDAAATKAAAQQQLALIEQKMTVLPSELDALKRRGSAEIAAEEARIREAAEIERQRMLESARREIGRRAQSVERRLVQRTGELAVAVATERVKRTITDEDQRRLVDRYLQQVRPETMAS